MEDTVASIRFRAEVGLDDAIEGGLDKDYYLWELDLEDVQIALPKAVYAELDFTVYYDEDEYTEEDMWFKICGEFDRPYRTDGGSEF